MIINKPTSLVKPVKAAITRKSKPVGCSKRVQFKYFSTTASHVYVAGDFNNWNPTKKPLKKNGKGEWSSRIMLPEGEVLYKYVVDGLWINDPGADAYRKSGLGTENSLKYV